MTETIVTEWGDPAKLSQSERAELDERLDFDTPAGWIAKVQEECEQTLRAAGFEIATTVYRPWFEVEHQGYASDSPEGFASRILNDIFELQEARANEDVDRAIMQTRYLTKKIEMWRMKAQFEPTWVTGRQIRKGLESRDERNSRRHQKALMKWTEWNVEAAQIWARNDGLSCLAVAKQIHRKLSPSENVETIRRRLKKPVTAR